MKIVYCTHYINNVAGVERITIAKANALAAIPGNEVWILYTDDAGHELTIPLLPQVHSIDLSIRYDSNKEKSMIGALLLLARMRTAHRHKIEEVLKDVQPDVVISTGMEEKNFLPSIRLAKRPVFIREMHFTKKYTMLGNWGKKQRLIIKLQDIYNYEYKIKRYDKVVVLTEEDYKDSWKCRKDIAVIPNPLTEMPTSVSTCINKKAIAVGRLAPQKNFASMIRVWKKVYAKHPDWTLDIWGDGPERNLLEQQINQSSLSSVIRLRGTTAHIMQEMSDASILLMTSVYEGFPLVLIESQSVGIPAVTYTYPCGAKDAILDSVNGFLVPQDNEAMMAERICHLIECPSERLRMGQTAHIMSRKYELKSIAQRWMDLFNELLIKRKKRKNA